MISIDSLTVEFSGTTLFKDISFVIGDKDRIALMGKNGAGKSTLLKIIAGVRTPTRGRVTVSEGGKVGYLPQHLTVEDGRTLVEETSRAFEHLFEIERQIAALNEQLTTRTDYESESYMRLIEEVTAISEKFYAVDLTNYQEDVERILLGLGFERSDFTRQTSEFSGGWRMRIELAKLLLQKPDLLLLDEPTNHLDIESIEWLEDFLMNNAKAVMVISHDKAFVDHITTRTIEITRGRIYDYKVNYSHYLELRRERREQQQAAYDNQQKMIAETREFIERFKGTYSKTNQVQSRVRMLEKLELIEVDEEDTSALNLRFPPAPRSGSYPVITTELGKAYGDHRVFSDVSITIERGDKVAFVGRNGEGKSTMVKAIMGQIDFEGAIQMGHNVKIGYFAQNEASGLDESITVFKTIDDIAVGDIRTRIRDILGAFMFGKDASEKLVKVLSGGERTRLAMIKLLLEPVNLLILDEPTNHLDMKTKDILKQALLDFDGTLIVVSHDRDFLDGLVTKVYEFGNQRVTEHLEGIYEFLQRKKMENLNELERNKTR
ncbi:ABC-F family ATP-binding cassette domain-containing protein [uncultured Parabacteroides sp.]|uniref:ABC-F family ATP-binding cassette domain-containing protein n=1 Tax=uncultured Parabacteroides sp. TaxID=512312 RepID=UPI0025FF04D8|nr:ABC-F family ATP-binding cassette domain-containing protein [uncultured Parabacteroides sp.]